MNIDLFAREKRPECPTPGFGDGSFTNYVFEEFHRGTWYICNTGLSHMNKGLKASVPCTTILFWEMNV